MGIKTDKEKVVIIVGPTASGKSALAAELAQRFNGEIVSADSMQVYRYMDIGTAKPTSEQRRMAAHHMIDIADPAEGFTAAAYSAKAKKAIHEIHNRGKNVFIAGGTGLYIRAVIKGLFNVPASDARIRHEFALTAQMQKQIGKDGKSCLYDRLKEVDPDAAARIHPNNAVRIIRALEVYHLTNRPISAFHKEHGCGEELYETIKIGILVDRKILYNSIENRVDNMIEAGLMGEVRGLLNRGYSPELKAMGSLGYKEIIGYIQNKYGFEHAVKEIKKNTRRYAKRQITWFKKEPGVIWFTYEEKGRITSLIEGFLA